MDIAFARAKSGLYMPNPGGLPGFQRQRMDQTKKSVGKGPFGGVTTWNPVGLPGTIGLSNNNRTALETGTNQFNNAQATTLITPGRKLYFEVTKVGVGQNSGGVPSIGFVPNGSATNNFVGSFVNSLQFLTYGPIQAQTGGVLFTGADWSADGSVVGVAVDTNTYKAWFRVGGAGVWNGGGTADPAYGVGGAAFDTASGSFVIACDPYSTGQGFILNTGQDAFAGDIPSGFSNVG